MQPNQTDQSLASISKNLVVSAGLGAMLGYAAGWSGAHLMYGLLFFATVTALAFLCSLLLSRKGFIVALAVIFAASVVVLALYSPPQTPIELAGKPPIPYAISRDMQSWWLSAELLRNIQNILGVSGVLCSLLIMMNIAALVKYTRWLAFVAAASFGILSAFDIGERANIFRQATRDVKIAIVRYQNESDYSMRELIAAYSQAANLIGPVRTNLR